MMSCDVSPTGKLSAPLIACFHGACHSNQVKWEPYSFSALPYVTWLPTCSLVPQLPHSLLFHLFLYNCLFFFCCSQWWVQIIHRSSPERLCPSYRVCDSVFSSNDQGSPCHVHVFRIPWYSRMVTSFIVNYYLVSLVKTNCSYVSSPFIFCAICSQFLFSHSPKFAGSPAHSHSYVY